jgi:ribose-phosphate pyrophosphokinase
MHNLDLTNLDKSDIKYKISHFPDGQQTIDLNLDFNFYGIEHFLKLTNNHIKIKSRLSNFKDLELILCATQALRNVKVSNISLYVPFFIGSRSDRKFQDGGINYLKQVIAPIINSQNYDEVIIFDPHSDVLEAVINNFVKINNFYLVKYALTEIDNKNDAQSRICFISPDAGAYKKIFDVAKEFKVNNIITANKVRDLVTGKIVKTEIPNLNFGDNMQYVIIDDIADGGRTFIELSKEIKTQKPNAKIYLIVSHGIFSAGLEALKPHFEKVYTTDSYSVIDDSFVKQFSLF